MEFQYSPSLETLLSSLEGMIVEHVPPVIGRARITEPCYAVFLWYHDSSVVDCTPEVGVGTDSVLRACQAQYSTEESRIDCLWRPQQSLDDSRALVRLSLKDRSLQSNCKKAYALIMEANKSEFPLDDEGVLLTPFRQMMRRVAARLNKTDWTNLIRTDESFVVVALDSIGYWLHDDLDVGLTRTSRDALLRRGLLLA